MLGRKPRELRHAFHFEIGRLEQLLGPLDAQPADVELERHAFSSFEQAREIVRCKAGHARHGREGQLFAVVPLHVGNGATNAAVLMGQRRVVNRLAQICDQASIGRKEIGHRSSFARCAVELDARVLEAARLERSSPDQCLGDPFEAGLEMCARRFQPIARAHRHGFDEPIEASRQQVRAGAHRARGADAGAHPGPDWADEARARHARCELSATAPTRPPRAPLRSVRRARWGQPAGSRPGEG